MHAFRPPLTGTCAFALSVALLAISGCAAPGARSGVRAPGADVVRIDSAAAYTPGSALAIDIENQGGNVTIIVDAALSQPEVRATSLEAGHTQDAAPWAAATLSPSGVSAPGATPILRVLASDISAAKRRTALEVRVPACAGVRVRSQSGGVSLSGVAGAIDVQNGSPVTEGGPVTMSTTALLDAPLLLHTSSGPVDVIMPAASRLDLEVTTSHGSVSVLANGVRATDVKATRQSWACALNGGDAQARISSDAGDVSVRLSR